MATQTEQQFTDEFHNLYTMHYANLLRDARKIATELGVEANIETNISLKVRDIPVEDNNWNNASISTNINSKIKV